MATTRRPEPEQGWWWQQCFSYLAGLLPVKPTDRQLQSAARAQGTCLFGRGGVRARVAVGHTGNHVEVVLTVRPWTAQQWRRFISAAAADDELAGRLLSGSFGAELGELCTRLQLPLFPPATRPTPIRCTCREHQGCRHAYALVLQVAAAVNDNPFYWLELLGQPREALLASLRAQRADRAARPGARSRRRREPTSEGSSLAGPPLAIGRLWETPTPPEAIRLRPGSALQPDALIRSLGPIPLAAPARVALELDLTEAEAAELALTPLREQPLETVLGQLVAQIARTATGLALGERPLVLPPEPLPGKPVEKAPRARQNARPRQSGTGR